MIRAQMPNVEGHPVILIGLDMVDVYELVMQKKPVTVGFEEWGSDTRVILIARESQTELIKAVEKVVEGSGLEIQKFLNPDRNSHGVNVKPDLKGIVIPSSEFFARLSAQQHSPGCPKDPSVSRQQRRRKRK